MSRITRAKSVLVRSVLVIAAIFLGIQAFRIFLVRAVQPPPREGVEGYGAVRPLAIDPEDSELAVFEMSIFFLPEYEVILGFRGTDYQCMQLGKQMNFAGRRVVGRLYYVEGSRLLPFHLSPDGYHPILYEITILGSVGLNCDALPQRGATSKLLLHRSQDSQALIYDGHLLPRISEVDTTKLQELYGLLGQSR